MKEVMKNSYDRYIRSIAKSHGFIEEGDLILWVEVERWANKAVHHLNAKVLPGSKGEVAVLLMALREEERWSANQELIESIIGAITSNCTCPAFCPVHSDSQIMNDPEKCICRDWAESPIIGYRNKGGHHPRCPQNPDRDGLRGE